MATQELVTKVVEAISTNRSTLARDPEPTARAIASIFGNSEDTVEVVIGLIRSKYRDILEIDPTPVAQLIVAALTSPS